MIQHKYVIWDKCPLRFFGASKPVTGFFGSTSSQVMRLGERYGFQAPGFIGWFNGGFPSHGGSPSHPLK